MGAPHCRGQVALNFGGDRSYFHRERLQLRWCWLQVAIPLTPGLVLNFFALMSHLLDGALFFTSFWYSNPPWLFVHQIWLRTSNIGFIKLANGKSKVDQFWYPIASSKISSTICLAKSTMISQWKILNFGWSYREINGGFCRSIRSRHSWAAFTSARPRSQCRSTRLEVCIRRCRSAASWVGFWFGFVWK